VKFLTAAIEPVPDASVRLPDAAVTSSPTKVTISPPDDGKVERIVIASPTSTQAGQVTPMQPVSGTIKIRETTDVVERLPVKATDTTD
jgi:hypothetical protein